MFSAITDCTASPESNFESCSTKLNLRRFRVASSPPSGLTLPVRIRRSVDFPEPLGPIRPIRSPSETVKEISRNSGFPPNDFVIPCALIISGTTRVSKSCCLRLSGSARHAPKAVYSVLTSHTDITSNGCRAPDTRAFLHCKQKCRFPHRSAQQISGIRVRLRTGLE